MSAAERRRDDEIGGRALTPWPFGDLHPLSFDLIVADPPWRFETWSEKGLGKSADAHYTTMDLEAIKALPVGQLARGDCLLLLWTTGWAMATGRAVEVCRAWDFEPVTELVWRKVYPSGKPRMGPGYRARSLHEPLILAKIGKPKHRALPSLFNGVARQHSRKPEEFYALVERAMPQANRLDLFSRQSRAGWTAWGDEAGKFDQAEGADA